MRLNIFSLEEEQYYKSLQRFRDRLFLPVCQFLNAFGVKSDYLSYLGFFMVVPFIYFFGSNPWLSALFLFLNVVFDALDGPLARFSRTASDRGAIIDVVCDHGSFVIFFLTILFFGLMTPFWALLYLIQYALMLAFVMYCRGHNVSFFPVFRSKYYVYLLLLFLLISGHNFYDAFLVLTSVYMIVTNIFLFDRIRCSKKF